MAFEFGEPVYPESDGTPVGETGRHVVAFSDILTQLALRFADRPDVYVGGNQFLYWVAGEPGQNVAPDIYVVLGRPKAPPRDTWKVWEEDGAVPAFILEITSKSTKATDLGAKKGLYAQLGVTEYAMFDPLGDYLDPRLQLFRLEGDTYVDVEPGAHGRWSEVLGCHLAPDGSMVRLRELDGSKVLRPAERADAEAVRAAAEAARAAEEAARADEQAARADEQAARADEQAARAAEEAARADEQAARAEEQAARADEQAARASEQAARTHEEAARADQEAARADSEAMRAERAEAELAALREQLRLGQRDDG